MTTAIDFVATPDEAGHRLDSALASRLGRSRSFCAQLIRGGLVRVNGEPVKPSHALKRGERVQGDEPPAQRSSAEPESLPIDILFDDADLCVVDKPAGMATHPARGTPRGTLVNALLAAVGPLPAINGVMRPGIVHRLDKDTSGLLVVAKSERAMRALANAMAARRIRREYDAVAWGVPEARGTIDAPIGRDPANPTRFAVRDDGRPAVTRYRVAERFFFDAASLLALELETGRTHQIRVHLLAIDHPIIGDATYGGGRPRLGMKRQALHASRLRFAHPITGQSLEFSSAWPRDFEELVARLRAGRVE